MELSEFHSNLNRKWQRKIHKSSWMAFFIILAVELIVYICYVYLKLVEPQEYLSHFLIRVALPSGINLITLCITRCIVYSNKFSIDIKNYAVCLNVLIICVVAAAVHNYYFIIWMAPSIALFYSTLFNSNHILTVNYIGTIFSAFISMTVNMIEEDFNPMVSMSYCIFSIGLFTCGYFICRIIVKHHKMQLEYIYQELEKKQMLIERLDIEPMTRLYNRKAFDRNLQEIVHNSDNIVKYKPKNAWLIIFDLDYFKSINDTYGHLNGDKVLLSVSSLMESIINKNGRVYRYGGEEFAVLTNVCTQEEVIDMTEQVRKGVELLKFDFDKNKKITISAGIASHNENVTIDSWIKNADEALYKAKRNGRNQSVLYK